MKFKSIIIFLSLFFICLSPTFAIDFTSPDNIDYLTNEYFDNINDIFVDQRNGHIYVPSYTGLINYYNGTDWTLYEVGEYATSIENIAVDSTGKMYIVSDCQIHTFDTDGSFVSSEATEGCYKGIAVDNEDNLYAILDSYIVKYGYNEEYEFTAWWDFDNSNGLTNNPSDIYIDQRNTVYVTDDGNRKVYRHIEGGDWETLPDLPQVDEPSGIYADSNGNVFVLDRDYGHVAMLNNETNEWSFYNDSDVLGIAEGVATYDDDNYLYVYVTNNTFGDKKVVKLTYNLPQSTPVSTSQLNNSSSSSSSSGWSAPTCSDSAPVLVPDLFQINTTSKTAKLFFTPIDYNQFYISFSTNPDAEMFGEQVYLLREGVQSHTIYHLKPNTTYYIKVRGQNGCMPGGWSNIMTFKTNNQTYYKNFSPKTSSKNIFTPISIKNNQTIESTPTPIIQTNQDNPINNSATEKSTPEHKKKCFLWWCW